MTRIVAISDTHGQHNKLKLPEGDILIHCGDFSSTGSQADHHEFSKWMGKQSHNQKLCTPGNHDRYSQQQTGLTKKMFSNHGVSLLIDESVEVDGIKMYFSPWTPTFMRWYWMKDHGRSIGRMWDNIPNDLDILVTHGPPWGILDISIYDNVHCGCKELAREVLAKQPRHHVFGHIHYYGGRSETHFKTTYHNAAVCDESYKPTNQIKIIDL